MAKYKIWDRTSSVLTYTGKVFTAEEWMDRHPILRIPSIVPVCGGGEINGSFMGTLGSMMESAEKSGCDFSGCTTDEERLAAIEAHEEARNTGAGTPTAEERIAAALEYQVLASLEDAEE